MDASEARKSGREYYWALGVDLSAELQYTHNSLWTLNSSRSASWSLSRSKQSQQIAPPPSQTWTLPAPHSAMNRSYMILVRQPNMAIINIFRNPQRIITDICPFCRLSLVSWLLSTHCFGFHFPTVMGLQFDARPDRVCMRHQAVHFISVVKCLCWPQQWYWWLLDF